MTEAEALQRYDAFLWKQVNAFSSLADLPRHIQPLEDFIQEARIAFLQYIRTYPESEWATCTLTIKGALYEYARRQYPLSVSRHGFAKLLREKPDFYPYDEYMLSLGGWYEDDLTDIDLRQALDNLSESDRQIIRLKLEGYTQKEIGDMIGRPQQTVKYRLDRFRRKASA